MSEVDDGRVCLTSSMMGQIVPLKKQVYDEFSLLSRGELLTLLSGACILS